MSSNGDDEDTILSNYSAVAALTNHHHIAWLQHAIWVLGHDPIKDHLPHRLFPQDFAGQLPRTANIRGRTSTMSDVLSTLNLMIRDKNHTQGEPEQKNMKITRREFQNSEHSGFFM